MRGIKKRRENSTDGKRVCIEDKPTPIEIVAQLTLLEVMFLMERKHKLTCACVHNAYGADINARAHSLSYLTLLFLFAKKNVRNLF